MASHCIRVVASAVLIALTPAVWSQDPVTIPPDKADTPWEVDEARLIAQLQGPTLDEVKLELDAWQTALKVQTIAINSATDGCDEADDARVAAAPLDVEDLDAEVAGTAIDEHDLARERTG